MLIVTYALNSSSVEERKHTKNEWYVVERASVEFRWKIPPHP